MLNYTQAFNTAKSVITANSPALLVGTAVAGVLTTGVLAAKAGYKARGIIDAEQAKRNAQPASAPLTNTEKFQLTWLCYAAPAVTGVSTIASVAGVHLIHTKRHAALAGLYAVTTARLDEYRDKAEELLGSKKTQQLNDALGQAAVDRNPISEKGINEVIVTGRGNELCYDDWSGRYFYSDMPSIEKAFQEVNLTIARDGAENVNKLWDKMGLTPLQIGESHGWSGTKVEPKFGSVLTDDGRSALTVTFRQTPKENCGVR